MGGGRGLAKGDGEKGGGRKGEGRNKSKVKWHVYGTQNFTAAFKSKIYDHININQ